MTTESVARWRDSGRFADVGGRAIFVVQDGDGPDVLILHGFPASSFDWRAVMPLIAPRVRATAFDFLGYGLSDKPADARFSLFELADLTEQIAALSRIERCVLVAHDLGTSVAAELCVRANEGRLPFGIDGVLLTNGSIFIDLVQLSPGQQMLLALPDEPLAEPLPLEAFKPGIAQIFAKERQPSDDELDSMLALIRHNGGDLLLPRLIRYIEERRANQPRWTAGFADFKGPLRALWGEQDPIAVPAMPAHLKEIRPDTVVTMMPDVGHWPPIEVPDRVAAEILTLSG